jgi:hypothetical protein
MTKIGRGISRLTACGALALVAATTRTSHAQYALGGDVSAVRGDANGVWGLGIDGRFGYRFGLPRAWIWHSLIMQLEAVAGYEHMLSGARDVDVGRLGGGGRLGLLLGAFEPFAFAHITVADAPAGWGNLWDVGAALDWRLATFNVGVHAARSRLNVADEADLFWEFGLHSEFRGFWF